MLVRRAPTLFDLIYLLAGYYDRIFQQKNSFLVYICTKSVNKILQNEIYEILTMLFSNQGQVFLSIYNILEQ